MRDERNPRMGADAATGDTPALPHAPLILVRSTVNLPGLPAGEEVLVDATNAYIQDCLRALFLVPLPAYRQPPIGDVQ